MKILTIGASPYLLVRNGKMHADLIESLVNDGHDVSSAVWHHDDGYFMPSEDGIHSYEKDGKNICRLYPFTPKTEEASPFAYELMKIVQPEVVITIGDYKDTNFIFAIKAMYPTLFKWIAIYTVDCNGISEIHKDAFEYTNYTISTSFFGLNEISSIASPHYSTVVEYGPDHNVFKYDPNINKEYILCSSRNAQASNIASFIKATAGLEIPYLHSNFYDPGDYNIDVLAQRYNATTLKKTEDYCSIKDGISNEKLCEIYNKSFIMVDCSLKSATGLSLLEGMACGCVPIGPDYGRIGEIISMMPKEFRFNISYNLFVGQNEEEFAVVSPDNLRSILLDLLENRGRLKEASLAAIDVSKKFSNKSFVDQIKRILVKVKMHNTPLVLDSL